MATRSGIGYDVHRLIESRPLILGGVEIASEKGLDGHSDADVLSHAIADALLGAVGLPDIGHFFPPTDESIKGISSLEILSRVASELNELGAVIVNLDSTLIAEKPKILPYADEMKERLTVRYWILIAANSGMRVGEQRQLKWSDVKLYEDKKKMYAQVNIRKETSKVRQSRVFNMRSGQHFKHLRETQQQLVNDGYVFSMCGAKSMHNKTVYKHFKVLMDLAEIKDWKKRRIVPYSLRHFCITQRRMAGVGYEEIADMCGTSVTQIRKVYWHLNDEVRHTTASKDYKRLNGKIIPL